MPSTMPWAPLRVDQRDSITGQTRDELIATMPSWDVPNEPLLVVVAEPGDEALLHGGLIAMHRRRHGVLHIISVTDGVVDGTESGSRKVRSIRREEQRRSLHLLGVSERDIEHHRIGASQAFTTADYQALAQRISSLATRYRLIVGPSESATSGVQTMVARTCNAAASRAHVRLASGLRWDGDLCSSPVASNSTLLQIPLDRRQQQQRLSAMALHRSQLTNDLATRSHDREHYRCLTWDFEGYALTTNRR